ncbi:MAG TPA: glycosyltransferase family 4 protein [Candidatus Angelobacter sp.]|nr:glycosyltransferase family 4 protein [Candidatus Angelobacter sp.]
MTYFRRRVGGTESYLQAMVPAYLERGHDIAVCYTDEGPLNRQPFDFPDKVPQWRLEDFGTAGALQRIRDWSPELIFCHGTTDMKFEAEVLKLAPGIFFAHNYVTCISGHKTRKFPEPAPCTRLFGPACLLQYFPRRCGGRSPITMAKLYREQAQRLKLMRSYAVIATNSSYLSEEYNRHGFATYRLPYPVFGDSKQRPRVIRPDAPRYWRLLFVGRMDRLKGGEVLLDALPAIRAGADRDIELVFVGDGPDRKRWQHKAERLQASVPNLRIEFKGWLEKANVGKAYAESDLLIVPSLWPEPCGVVGVEAGLYGVPTVAFRVGGIPDWLHAGENGFLAHGDPPTAAGLAEAVVRALDPKIHPDLCQGARTLAQSWTLQWHCDEFDLLVEKVIKGGFAGTGPAAGRGSGAISAANADKL